MKRSTQSCSEARDSRRFLLAEVIVGAAIAGMLAGLFCTTTHLIRRMEEHLVSQALAIRVLDNTLERLRHTTPPTVEQARAVLEQELRACEDSWDVQPVSACVPTVDGLVLRVGGEDGKFATQVTLAYTNGLASQRGEHR